MSVKISLIGAGSGTFSINLVKDLCLARNLADSTISLMDVDEERLNDVYRFCVRYAEEVGAALKIEKTMDRKESMRNADFVVNTALVGGYCRLWDGWKIAKKWGYHFGGSFHIVHDEAFWVNFYQIKLMEEIYLDIQKVCPNAWYVLVANPVMAGTTYLQRKYPGIRMVGMCHGYGGVYWLAKLLGMDREKMNFQVPGINHFVWLNSFTYEGRDAFEILDQWIAKHSDEYFKTCPASDQFGPKPIDLYQKYGVMPIGDTCTPGGGSWGWWYHADTDVQRRWKEDPDAWYEKGFSDAANNVKRIHDAAWDKGRPVSQVFSTISSDEPMVPLIEALACDIPRVVIVNTLNDHEYVQGVPRDFEVEIPAYVSKRGIQGIQTKPLPKPVLNHMLHDRIAPVETELCAFSQRSRELLIQLIMMDPYTKSREQAEGFLKELFELPYLKEMKEYYK